MSELMGSPPSLYSIRLCGMYLLPVASEIVK
jgi:hypothetical protein